MKTLVHFAVVTFSAVSMLGSAAKADEAALFGCINRYKSLGISPDAALTECKKNELAECVKRLVGMNFVALSVGKGPDGYLIDLGNSDSRWLEGGAWRDKGCTPNLDGPKRRQQAITSWGADSVSQWFRQGKCKSETLELNQPNSLEDAKLRCELQPLEAGKKM